MMQMNKLLLLGPIVISLAIMLFPRRIILLQWLFLKWLVSKKWIYVDESNYQLSLDRSSAEQMLRQYRERKFWHYRWGAFVMLLILISAVFFL